MKVIQSCSVCLHVDTFNNNIRGNNETLFNRKMKFQEILKNVGRDEKSFF